ncbi:MAG: DUF2752 domain-containing protein [Fibrobacter intestinalis]|uniref:DUF2752 domain-containing protein n=1 Tax=Fibrobacter intestinalis TaxID=28122 RepID=UPI003F0527E0
MRLKKIFGIPCPGCGTLRSLNELLHGDFSEAFYFNPLTVLLAFSCLFFLILSISDAVLKTHRTKIWLHKHLHFWQKIVLLIAVAANWAFNLIKFAD